MRSFALPEFDPFWKLVEEADIVVGMHASDSGYQRHINEWEGVREGEFTPFAGGGALRRDHRRRCTARSPTPWPRPSATACAPASPSSSSCPVENGSGWVRPLIHDMEKAYEFNPHLFDEDPVEVLKRNVFVHPFHEEDPKGLVEIIGADNVLFGSDFPHPEGMSDPITFVDDLEGLAHDDVAKVMGGNLGRLMNVA